MSNSTRLTQDSQPYLEGNKSRISISAHSDTGGFSRWSEKFQKFIFVFRSELFLPHTSMPKRPNVFGSDSDLSESDGDASRLRRPKKLVLPKSEESATEVVAVDRALNEREPSVAQDDAKGTDFMLYPLEKDIFSSSIDTPLFQSNSNSIGLSMMEKMGFKLGDSLGKSGASSASTLLEPIKVIPNSGRAGIGALSEADRSSAQEVAATSEDKFMGHLKEQQLEKHNQKVCQKLMKLCVELNEDEDKPVMEINPLWRSYCFFCGCFYNDANDMRVNCPGVEESFHKLS
ncbi:hypothetical protein CLIB1423_25S00914 [[Candida] railenensis]|uniref:G-patch domain-containing protein n=1 Tax=[Candida] railenensis TaxID=45579 RepID=A0A9P0QUU7_9ASCO|nr:hypothetical protein CLIB1423_25S00914 [[Candida] railenensis]